MARELSEKHKKAMQVGRQKAQKAKRVPAIQRVEAYNKWSAEDARVFGLYHDGKITRDEWLAQKPKPLGFLPTDADFRLWRGEE